MVIRDHVKPGQLYSADYLKVTDLDSARSFDTMYKLLRCRAKTAADAGVISLLSEFEEPDTSEVYLVQCKNPNLYFGSWEFTGDQTGTELLPALDITERYVIEYGSVRADSTTGEAWVHDGSIVAFKGYFTKSPTFTGGALYIPFDPGTAIKFTSTQGSDPVYVALNYYIETVVED